MFTTGLVAWTIGQYSRAPRALSLARPIHLPIRARVPAAKAPALRLVA
jgi:hypothetical protein